MGWGGGRDTKFRGVVRCRAVEAMLIGECIPRPPYPGARGQISRARGVMGVRSREDEVAKTAGGRDSENAGSR